MFLRIDKVIGVPNSPPAPSNDSLHACLATAATVEPNVVAAPGEEEGGPAVIPDDTLNASGELFVVGRKNAAVTIDDKCVSRKHASIHLLSKTNPFSTTSSSPEILHGRLIMEYGTPSSPEEIAACDSSPSGVICVLRDLGSKFGTFVQVDEDLINATTPRTSNTDAVKEGSGNETGDETDDEGVNNTSINYATLSDGQVQAVRLLCDNNGSSSSSSLATPKFQKVEPNKSVTLLPLSHSTTPPPHHHTSLSSSEHITPKSTLQSYIDSLHYIGASHNQWDVNQSTHLVALEKKANAKAITAWASGRKSVVTLEYIDGLLGRKELGDVLPREEDYPPKGTSQLDSLSYSGDHSRALQGYCIAVMMEDDNGPLAQSAGAKILKVYDAPDSSQADFDNWWNTQQQNAIDAKMVLVLVDSKSSKCKPYNTWLHKRNDVRLTSAKHLAQAITGNNGEGDLLLDAKKVAIEKMEGWDAAIENVSAKKQSRVV
ncbi:nibrin-related protein [Skeletonema marinoi]|uniref:Nibrin-related protein n=1 Tax=Skeletonema marinoi TaxID=267567 RepID=A0AAD8YEE8_9STRA|nr:nibrin-related protein [Skeletonema marinoi]